MKLYHTAYIFLILNSHAVFAQDAHPNFGNEEIPAPDSGDEEVLELDLDEEESTADNSSNPDTELERIEVKAKSLSNIIPGARPSFSQTIKLPYLQSINDWLESAPGVYGDASGKGTRSIIVRGFETRQITFQLDGMPLDTGYDGMTGMDVIPMNWISTGRIEHADSSPTDAVGLGGKVDLYPLDPSLLEANMEISRFGFIGSVSHGMRKAGWHWVATAGGQYSNGFYLSHAFEETGDEDGGLRDYSYKAGGNVFVKVSRVLGYWGIIEIMGGWADAPRGVPTGVNTGYRRYWDFTDWTVAFGSARLSFIADYFLGQVQFWTTYQSNQLEAYDNPDRNTQTLATASTSVWHDYDFGGKIEVASIPWSIGSAGLMYAMLRTDLRYQTHDSSETAYSPKTVTDKDSSRFYFDLRPALDWLITSDIRLFAAGNFTGAVAIAQNSSDNTDLELGNLYNGGFSFGFDYYILPSLEVALRAARRLRMPTIKEQFRNIPLADGPIPKLNAEVAWDFEAEIHYTPIEEVALTVGAFDIEVRDLIEFQYINGTKLAYNVSKARMAGVDTAITLGPWVGISLDLAYHYLYAYDLSNDHVLNDRPAHNFRGVIHYSPIQNLRFTVGAQVESKRRTEAWLTTKYAWMGNIFLLDAQVEYSLEHVSLYLRGTNLTDYNYQRSFGYPEPGFNITLGAKIMY